MVTLMCDNEYKRYLAGVDIFAILFKYRGKNQCLFAE